MSDFSGNQVNHVNKLPETMHLSRKWFDKTEVSFYLCKSCTFGLKESTVFIILLEIRNLQNLKQKYGTRVFTAEKDRKR